MSWFARGGPMRSSLRRNPSPSPPKELDANACYESFKMHWQQAWDIISKPAPSSATNDNIRSVLTHVDQMVTLLLHDVKISNHSIGPLLDHLLTENILDKLFEWSVNLGENIYLLKYEQLKLYETLISHSQQELLVHKPILQPLLRLLSTCSECAPVEVEKRLVILLNQLCVSLSQNATLLDFFFSVSSQLGPSRFLIFTLLIPFLHREGAIGQQARDALLLCMSLTRKNDSIGLYIAEHSNFCPILATGLNGLYSLLPRKLIIETEDWHRFTMEDVNDFPELALFMNSFEFCNAIIQVSYPLVQEQLLEYLYQGFLVPVLGPALHQTTVEENIAATAYLDLFIRRITEPALLQSFIKFIFTESYEGSYIIDSLITRIGNQSRLCLVTLAIFRTLIDLNCEDIMLQLVFRYLIPCTHVMLSQRSRIHELDLRCKTAEKFLSLIPACCQIDTVSQPRSSISSSESVPVGLSNHRRNGGGLTDGGSIDTPSTHNCRSNFYEYLEEAQKNIANCTAACRDWIGKYDGEKVQGAKPRLKQPSLHDENNTILLNYTNDSSTDLGYRIRKFSDDLSQSESDHKSMELCTKSTSSVNSYSRASATVENIANDVSCVQSNDDVSENGDDDIFWSLINRCATPPLETNLEEAFQQMDSTIDQLLTQHCNRSHSSLTAISKSQDVDANSLSSTSSLDNDIISDDKDETAQDNLNQVETTDKSSAPVGVHPLQDSFGNPDIGPFLNMLFTKLENMMQNNLYINLQLTGIITRLACYPHPLLRSFLLNHSLVFQPSVRPLLQVLGSLKQRLDTFSSTIDNFPDLLSRARKFLYARESRLRMESDPTVIPISRSRRNSSPENRKFENRRRTLTDILFRRPADRSLLKGVTLEGIPDGTGYRYINRPFPGAPHGKLESLKTKNAVLCAVVLEEFLTELAAVTQEHAATE